MSTPRTKPKALQELFRLLKAILAGLGLGFFAVTIVTYVFPEVNKGQSLAQAAGNVPALAKARDGGAIELGAKTRPRAKDQEPIPGKAAGNDARPAGRPRVQESKSEPGKDAKVPVPAAPEPAKEAPKALPPLVPAENIRFPKVFPQEHMTAALQPLLSFKLSQEDAKATKEAVEAAARDDDGDARAAIKKIGDPAAKAFAEWRRSRRSSADFKEAMAFRLSHPLFPEPPQDAVSERALFLSGASSASVLKFYTNRMPLTGAGRASLGGALLETGERQRGLAMIKFAWRRFVLDPAVEEQVRSRYGSLLDESDHLHRRKLLAIQAVYKQEQVKKVAADTPKKGLKAAVRLRAKAARMHRGRHGPGKTARRKARRGAEDSRAVTSREARLSGKARALGVTGMAELVRLKRKRPKNEDSSRKGEETKKPADKKAKQEKEEKPAETRQAKAAQNAFNLAKERVGGPGTLLARLKALRREGADDDVWSLLRSIRPDAADLADPNLWWDFRRGEIRRALSHDHPKTAYAIATVHGPLDGENLSEAEFLAGWIALRFMQEPQRAVRHFEASRVAGLVRNEARASYWLGRAKQELHVRAEARAHFAAAAGSFHTFYGILARQMLRTASACEFRAPPQPSKEAVAAFVNEDAFKAVMIAKQLQLDQVLAGLVLDFARQLRDPEQMTLTLELAERVAPPHVTVRAAKIALLRGFAAEAYAYPTLLPKYDQAGPDVKLEPALLHALTRQESEFYTGTVSHVGARGLMQLMPGTAKQVAAAVKMKYEAARLISDPSYNVTLGSAFLARLLSAYNGSYVLSLAAYNAGPGRIAEWTKDFGDPRDKSVDPVDWVEHIPFTETRLYVQKILESTQLYRCRFERGKTRFQIVEDLHRGRPGKVPDLKSVAGSAGEEDTP